MRYELDGWNIIEDEIFTGNQKREGMDNHAEVVALNYTRYVRCEFIACGASEAIKASNKSYVEFVECKGTRGIEDFADFVGCQFVKFIRCTFPAPAKGEGPQDVTAKGGCSDFEFEDCTGLRKVVMGNYTIYDGRAYKSRWQLWPQGPKTTRFKAKGCGLPVFQSFWADRAVGSCKATGVPLLLVAVFFYVRFWCFPEKGANAVKPVVI